MNTVVISKDYTLTPGPRNIRQGKFSGEDFRKRILEPKFKDCLRTNSKLIVDLDGTYGYFDSFLEEAFGGLARIYTPEEVKSILDIVSNEDPKLKDKVYKFIKDSSNEKK